MEDNFFDILKDVNKANVGRLIKEYTDKSSNPNYNGKFDNIVFKQFDSLKSVYDKIKEVRDEGSRDEYKEAALGMVSSDEYSSFSKMMDMFNYESDEHKEAKKITNSLVKNAKSLVNLGGSFKNSKLKITSDDRGLFDFSLASQGLFRPIEYYNEDIGIVNEDLVDNYRSGKNNVFYTKIDGVEHILERRQKGTTLVFSKFSDECVLKKDSNGIVLPYSKRDTDKVFNGKGDFRLKYSSRNKKSYLIYEKQSDSAKYVDFYVPVNFTGVSDGFRFLNVLYVLIIASILDSFGIKSRISAVRHGMHGNGVFEFMSITLKDYNESVDDKFDIVLNVLGQSDVASSLFGFLVIYYGNHSGQKDKFGNLIKSNSRSNAYGSKIIYQFLTDTQKFFNRFKNWSKEEGNLDVLESKVVDDNFRILTIQNSDFNLSFFNSLAESNKESLVSNLTYTMFLVYFYLDYIAIDSNPLNSFVYELNKRFDEDENFKKLFEVPKNREDRKELITMYISGLLTRKYDWNEKGVYADSKLQIAEKKRIFDDKLDSVREALTKI